MNPKSSARNSVHQIDSSKNKNRRQMIGVRNEGSITIDPSERS